MAGLVTQSLQVALKTESWVLVEKSGYSVRTTTEADLAVTAGVDNC